jgi:hypothetical protein
VHVRDGVNGPLVPAWDRSVPVDGARKGHAIEHESEQSGAPSAAASVLAVITYRLQQRGVLSRARYRQGAAVPRSTGGPIGTTPTPRAPPVAGQKAHNAKIQSAVRLFRCGQIGSLFGRTISGGTIAES